MRLALALAGTLLLAGCTHREPLPMLGEVPPFQLISQTGQPFDRASLNGKPWVANFFFTTCTGPCPRMSAQMRVVQNLAAGLPDVRLVSFSVDPEHDTPTVLADYARRYQARAGRWFFLTGDAGTLNQLGLQVFHLNAVDGTKSHSTRFILVDRRGQIRGYYLSSEEDFMKRLLRDLHQVNSETR